MRRAVNVPFTFALLSVLAASPAFAQSGKPIQPDVLGDPVKFLQFEGAMILCCNQI